MVLERDQVETRAFGEPGERDDVAGAIGQRSDEGTEPEVVAVQKMQDNQARAFNRPGRLSSRLMLRLLPLLFRTGLLLWVQRKERRLMSEGVAPVRLVV